MNGIKGPETSSYSVPRQAERIFHDELLGNPLISKYLPSGIAGAAAKVRFTGTDDPTMPVNWRLAESASALLALEAALVGQLLEKKYNVQAPEVEINRSAGCLMSQRQLTWFSIQRTSTTLLDVIVPLDD